MAPYLVMKVEPNNMTVVDLAGPKDKHGGLPTTKFEGLDLYLWFEVGDIVELKIAVREGLVAEKTGSIIEKSPTNKEQSNEEPIE